MPPHNIMVGQRLAPPQNFPPDHGARICETPEPQALACASRSERRCCGMAHTHPERCSFSSVASNAACGPSSSEKPRRLKPAARNIAHWPTIHLRNPIIWVIVALLASAPALANEEPATPAPTATTARQAVLDGNRALAEDDAAAALEAYRHAEQIKPDALEIQFDKALGHYKLGEYEEARRAFERAATSDDPSLASDALYGVGTTYHAEAIKNREDPAKSIEGLENAIRRYQDVLADAPDHEAARSAFRKASTMRKQLKQLLEQQEQQQNQDGKQKADKDKSNDQQKQDQSDDQKQKEDQKQNQEQSDKKEGDQQQQSKDSDQPQDQDQPDKQADANDTDKQNAQEQQNAEKPEQRESNEQAERQLREMVQSMRERKKHRRQVKRIPLQPVDKDW